MIILCFLFTTVQIAMYNIQGVWVVVINRDSLFSQICLGALTLLYTSMIIGSFVLSYFKIDLCTKSKYTKVYIEESNREQPTVKNTIKVIRGKRSLSGGTVYHPTHNPDYSKEGKLPLNSPNLPPSENDSFLEKSSLKDGKRLERSMMSSSFNVPL